MGRNGSVGVADTVVEVKRGAGAEVGGGGRVAVGWLIQK